ncbi:MAG: Zn-ribbon domain-containing OB-fold protein [Candidatus Thorarchaeota archaeon]|nr:MAG: Zn-ribbon domain-containing OB-fold protein [Candidatus Thorarchaeota archaeon]
MTEKPTIEQYLKNIEARDFQPFKCVDCGTVIAPPSGTCYSCGSNKMEWTRVSGKGTLVSFTVIHIASDEFQEEAPYFIAIVELEEGTRVTGRLQGFDPLKPEEVGIGTLVVLDYETGKSGKTYLAFRPE